MNQILSTLTFLTITCISFSQETIVTDRPDQTESSQVVPLKTLQIESGLTVMNSYENGIRNTQMQLPTSLFRLSISKKIEFRVVSGIDILKTNNYYFFGSPSWETSMADIELGTKISLYDKESSSFKFAILGHVIIPTSGPASNNQTGLVSRILLQHDLGENWSIGYNFGYDYSGTGDGDLAYTIAAGTSLSEKFGYYFEVFGAYQNLENFIINADAGITYLLVNNVQLDYSFGTGILNQRMNYHSIGCSWRIPN